MNDIITISGLDRPTITITPDAEKLKSDALILSAQVGTIEDDMDRDMADKPMRDINNLLKALEKCRTEIKAPVLQAGKDIDTAAKNWITAGQTWRDLNGSRQAQLKGTIKAKMANWCGFELKEGDK